MKSWLDFRLLFWGVTHTDIQGTQLILLSYQLCQIIIYSVVVLDLPWTHPENFATVKQYHARE